MTTEVTEVMDTPDRRTADTALLALALKDARNHAISLLDDWAAWKDGVSVEGLRSPHPLRRTAIGNRNGVHTHRGVRGGSFATRSRMRNK